MYVPLFGKNKANKTKVVLKTAKGRGPIRKIKVAIGAGVIAAVISPVVTPWLETYLGEVPDGAVHQIAELLIANYEVIATLVAAYFARPGNGDQPVTS